MYCSTYSTIFEEYLLHMPCLLYSTLALSQYHEMEGVREREMKKKRNHWHRDRDSPVELNSRLWGMGILFLQILPLLSIQHSFPDSFPIAFPTQAASAHLN